MKRITITIETTSESNAYCTIRSALAWLLLRLGEGRDIHCLGELKDSNDNVVGKVEVEE